MESWLAGFFAIAAFADMGLNDCQTACLGKEIAPERFSTRAAAVFFNGDVTGQELFLGYDAALKYGPFQPTVALSFDADQTLFLGGGVKWTSEDMFSGPIFVEGSLTPGLHLGGSGPDIGGAIQFRSHIGIGYAFDGGATLSLVMDHRSNGYLEAVNPGLETVGLQWTFPLN